MIAVGFVVLNRVKHRSFQNDICKVVYQPGQFSWVGGSENISDKFQWELSRRIALKVVTNEIRDPTANAVYFHRSDIGIDWSSKRIKKTVVIGDHQFYNSK